LFFLLAINIYQLLNNSRLKQKNLKIQEEIVRIDKQINATSIKADVSSSKNIISHSKIISKDIFKVFKGLRLLVLVPEISCSSCLKYEIPEIKKLQEKYSELISFFVIGNRNSFLESYNLGFKYKILPIEGVFSTDIYIPNPAVLLINDSGDIFLEYVAEVGNEERSSEFYRKIDLFISSTIVNN